MNNPKPPQTGENQNVNPNTWQQVNPRKTKRSESTITRNVRQKTTTANHEEVIPTQNRFLPIAKTPVQTKTKTIEHNNQETSTKVPKPPPIFIPDVSDVKPLLNILNLVAKDNYHLKSVGNGQVKVQINSIDLYRRTVETLKENQVLFHTYQIKEERTHRAVIKNLHHSTNLTELKTEIEEKGHTVANIYNIKHRINKNPLPIFFVELKPNANNKAIFDINHLQYTKVQIEPPKPKKDVPQCSRCQLLGHTKTYCMRRPRCVKCGDNHLTPKCDKDKNTPVKCALCEGNHPANYKGCTVYKEIQKRKFPPLRERKMSHTVNPNLSYAQATNNDRPEETQNNRQTPPQNNKLEEMMIQLMGRMDTILNLLTTLVSQMSK